MKRFPTLIVFVVMGYAMQVYAQSPLFSPAPGSPVTVGEGSGRVVLVDVNRDGRLDLVTQHLQRRIVAVHLGDGTGHFAPAPGSPITLTYSPGDIKLGDVNSDGILDLGVTNSERNAVDIFLGNGSGRFSPAPGSPFLSSASAEFTTHSLQLVDINEDGKLDIITTNNQQNTIATLIGNGRGSFSQGPTATFPAGQGRYAFAFGDLDGDGHLDAVIANGEAGFGEPGRAMMLRGDGKGAFNKLSETPVPTAPRYVTLGDVDGDGRPDIVTTHGNNQLSVLLNRGGGKFAPAPASPYDLGALAWAVFVADVNRDKQNDLVLATEDSITVLLNSRSGFAPAPGSPFGAGPGAYYLATGDINQDGNLDVVASSFGGKAVTVLLRR
ncbi:MAG TPA: VCBS repeat-containing protein [Blastocatellia bacterium]|nr:VCBS repeat-containing protein [Blastocatellia bacterium]